MTAPYPATTPTGSAPNTPARRRGRDLLGPVEGLQPAHPLQVGRRDGLAGPVDRAGHHQGRGRSAASAATSPATSTSTPTGNLYLATGDNTPASAPGANGFAPEQRRARDQPRLRLAPRRRQHERPARQDPADHVQDDGTYTIPDGQPVPAGNRPDASRDLRDGRCATRSASTSTRRPAALTWGDYGPDAGARRPASAARWATSSGTRPPSTSPLNGGWPYCTGRTASTTTTGTSRRSTPRGCSSTAPAAPRTPRAGTPAWSSCRAAAPADLYYGDNDDAPAVARADRLRAGGGQGPMGGPVYHYDADEPVDDEVPGVLGRQGVLRPSSPRTTSPRSRRSGRTAPVDHIEHFLPNAALTTDGSRSRTARSTSSSVPTARSTCSTTATASSAPNPDAGLYRIDYAAGNKAPQAQTSPRRSVGQRAPLTVDFRRRRHRPTPTSGALTYEWDFDGNGTFDATGVRHQPHLHGGRQYTARCGSPTAGGGRPDLGRRSAWATSPRSWRHTAGTARSSTGARRCRSRSRSPTPRTARPTAPGCRGPSASATTRTPTR